MNEQTLHLHVAEYLKWQYPNVIFRTDYAAGLKLTKRQAGQHKALQSGRAYPDLFIAAVIPPETGGGKLSITRPHPGYSGLYIELKAEGETLQRKNGNWASRHIAEQAATLAQLTAAGYYATFAVGFNQAKQLIDWYLSKCK